MTLKGKSSEVGAEAPTNETKERIDSLVDDVLGPKKAPEQADTGLSDEEESDESEGLEDTESLKAEDDGASEESVDSKEESEEVVPKSKHQKALDKQQRRIDELTNKIRQMEVAAQKKPETQSEKLEALAMSDLEELLDNTTDAIAEAKYEAKNGADVSKKIEDLQTLRRNIRQTIKDSPNRVVRKQTEVLQAVIEEVKDLDPDVSQKKGKLWELAARIYTSSPSLQKTVTGQGEAMRLAAEHFLAIQQSSQGLEKVSDLSKRVNKLKQKTNLDGNVRRGNEQVIQQRKIRDKAINGTYDDKLAFVRTLIPDDFLQVV